MAMQQADKNFLDESGEKNAAAIAEHFVDTLRMRIDTVKGADAEFKEYYTQEKKRRRRRTVKADSDLSDFIVD